MAVSAAEIDSYFEEVIAHINLEKLLKPLQCRPFTSNPSYVQLPDYLSSGNADDKRIFVKSCLLEDKTEFVFLLLHTGQYNAAIIIEPTVREIIDPKLLDPSNENKTITCPYIISDIRRDILLEAEDPYGPRSNAYRMTRSPRGYCVLINNYLTYGTFKEMQRFRNIFYQLHFEVIMETNVSAEKIMNLLTRLSQSECLEDHDAFCCMIISHGTSNSEILGFDDSGFGGEPIKIDTVCNVFNDTNCPMLKRKPRICIFNCCRGEEKDETFGAAASLNVEENTTPEKETTPHWRPVLQRITDFLICYSTLDGYAAYVDWNEGTVFGGVLLTHLVEKAYSRDLNSILTRTNNDLLNMIPTHPFDWKLSFRKDLIFNPGFPHKIALTADN